MNHLGPGEAFVIAAVAVTAFGSWMGKSSPPPSSAPESRGTIEAEADHRTENGRLLREYLIYYHSARPHLSQGKDSPEPPPVERRDEGRVVETPMVGGLHHRYTRQAA